MGEGGGEGGEGIDADAEDAREPGRAGLGTVRVGAAPHSEGFLQASAWKENLGSFWEPPAPAGLAEQAWKMVNDHLDQLQAFSWLVSLATVSQLISNCQPLD